MTVCERIDQILEARNLSRRKLAIAAGIAPSSFQSAMARNKGLSLDMLFPISDVLNIPLEVLSGIEVPELSSEEQIHEQYQRLSPEMKILSMLPGLNDVGQQKAVERVEELTEIPKYRRQDTPSDEDTE